MQTIIRHAIGPLFLIAVCPPTVILFWYTLVSLDGSLLNLYDAIAAQGFFNLLWSVWGPIFFGSPTAWKMLAVFASVQLLFMRFLPGRQYLGPITPKGNIPLYKANGVPSYIFTLFLWFVGGYVLQWFSPTIVYDHFGELLGALNLFSLGFCLLLLIKGFWAPSSSDTSKTGNFLFDYYWGTELYPRLFGWDVKMFTNCRMGLMGWAVIILSFAAKQQQLYGLSDSMFVAVALQLVYITKFFYWETGYLSSLDIMHDHAGFYICWGCLVWVPGIYTSATLYLVNHPNELGWPVAASLLIAGTFCILANYFADRQRQQVRQSQGQCLVWGRQPQIIEANYTTEQGIPKKNLLLASGWWGIARHFHYIPEILGAFFWSAPALFASPLPYFYVVFLTLLLFDRAFRDDERCGKKYGADWQKYCQKVPYKMIPFVI